MHDLAAGFLHAARDHVRRRALPARKPGFQHCDARRQDEDRNNIVRHLVMQGVRTLPVHIEQDVMPGLEPGYRVGARGAVIVIEHLRPFEKLPPGDHGAELIRGFEEIIDAFGLVRPGCARGRGNGELDVLELVEQHVRQRGLAGPGGARQDEHQPPPLDCRLTRHSPPAP